MAIKKAEPMNRLGPLCALIWVLTWGIGARPLQQPHAVTPEEVENGGRLYQSACARCHGATGDAVTGVNLGSGRFRRASSDDELARIVIDGIPGTGMPPNSVTVAQATTIVAYLRSLALAGKPNALATAASTPGDATRGRALLAGKGQCLTCHRIDGVGGRSGPDLSEVGARTPEDLSRSLVDPNAEVRPEHRSVRAVTRNGATMTGKLLNQDTFSLQLLDASEQLRSVLKSDLREYTILETSAMPSYRETLSAQELADVVGYLTTLRGRP